MRALGKVAIAAGAAVLAAGYGLCVAVAVVGAEEQRRRDELPPDWRLE